MAFQHYRTQAVFLKKEDRGEADQLLTVFTKDFGRLEILARAIRKITSKLRSGAGLFSLSEIEFIQGKNYKTLTDAVAIGKFQNITSQPEKLDTAHCIAEAVDALLVREEPDERIWRLLAGIFKQLSVCKLEFENSLKIENCKLKIFHYFFWNFVALLGYTPELYSCAACSKKLLPEVLFFCPRQGGVVCWQCKKKEEECQEILVDTIKTIRLFLKEPIDVLKQLKIGKETRENLAQISDSYFNHLKSLL